MGRRIKPRKWDPKSASFGKRKWDQKSGTEAQPVGPEVSRKLNHPLRDRATKAVSKSL